MLGCINISHFLYVSTEQWQIFQWQAFQKKQKMAVQMTTDTVKNAKMTTELVVNFVFFEMLTTEKSATVLWSQ